MELDEIKRISLRFREVLETLPVQRFHDSSFFSRFPKGCCGDASHLLAKYLKDNGMSPYYVWGWKGRQSHAWIELDDLIIDITADQFDEIEEKVIIEYNSEFHMLFEVRDRYLSDFDTHDKRSAIRYRGIYDYVIESIESNEKNHTSGE